MTLEKAEDLNKICLVLALLLTWTSILLPMDHSRSIGWGDIIFIGIFVGLFPIAPYVILFSFFSKESTRRVFINPALAIINALLFWSATYEDALGMIAYLIIIFFESVLLIILYPFVERARNKQESTHE